MGMDVKWARRRVLFLTLLIPVWKQVRRFIWTGLPIFPSPVNDLIQLFVLLFVD